MNLYNSNLLANPFPHCPILPNALLLTPTFRPDHLKIVGYPPSPAAQYLEALCFSLPLYTLIHKLCVDLKHAHRIPLTLLIFIALE